MAEYLHNARSRARKRLAFDDLPPSPSPFYYYGLLTVRERRYVDIFIVCLDARDAARRAGYGDAERAIGDLLADKRVRAAIRERQDAVSELASITAADVRRELKQIYEADSTELSGVWKIPCRHCWGINNQYQYTGPEMMYIERAHAYGGDGWPMTCITAEFGGELYKHAHAAFIAGRQSRPLDTKGGDGYSRNEAVNPNCPQCSGQGTPMAYVCDTRRLSEGARRMYQGLRMAEGRLEIVSMDRQRIREMLARDVHVGVERKVLSINMPRTVDEFNDAIRQMSYAELEQLVSGMVELSESEYEVIADLRATPEADQPRTKLTRRD